MAQLSCRPLMKWKINVYNKIQIVLFNVKQDIASTCTQITVVKIQCPLYDI